MAETSPMVTSDDLIAHGYARCMIGLWLNPEATEILTLDRALEQLAGRLAKETPR